MWLRSYCGEVKLAGLMVEASGFTGDMAECYSKKYTWLEMDYGRSDKETKEDFCCQSDKRGKAGDSDISMMKQQMMEIGVAVHSHPPMEMSPTMLPYMSLQSSPPSSCLEVLVTAIIVGTIGYLYIDGR
ncbi:uncharacterized protein [Aegilops tauschii subsp. strangulata]|nr:poly [ADP-ribose] polymerase 2-B isoform X3 [Aegilops tauschii subsp. strangulata]XP_040259483.1 poly [ADP-ribose] polymerase 2-B isoform X3 [Aegilops tauschii subsp. strangulata]